jgi:hypothetical protein
VCLTRAAMRVPRERLKPVLCRIASRPLLSHDHSHGSRVFDQVPRFRGDEILA